MDIVRILASGVIGYGIGSISSGYLVGRLYRNVDLRKVGSGSTGATNTFRTLGLGAGLLVAVLDILKGAGSVWIAMALVSPNGEDQIYATALAAVAAVAGHCWPAFLAGRGGRGVATGFGALLFIATPAWLGAVVGFMLALAITRMVSVGSLAAVAGAVIGYLVFVFAGYLSFHWAVLGFILAAGAIVTFRHRANLARIVRGSEPRVGRRRSPST